MAKTTYANKIVRLMPWLASLVLVGCIFDEDTDPVTNLDIMVDQTAKAVGEEFTFTYAAQGTALSRVVIDFGDGASEADTTFFGGRSSSSMEGSMVHAYIAAGSYTVVGWVEDLAVGADTVQLMVSVSN